MSDIKDLPEESGKASQHEKDEIGKEELDKLSGGMRPRSTGAIGGGTHATNITFTTANGSEVDGT